MRKIVFLFLILISARNIYGQVEVDGKIDSLLNVLKAAKGAVARVDALNALAYEFRTIDPDTAIYFSNEALTLATKANYSMGQADGYLWEGVALLSYGEYEEVLENCKQAIKLYDEILSSASASEKSGILYKKAFAYGATGSSYWNQGDFAEALKNHQASLRIREEIKDKEGVAKSLNSIGNVHLQLGNYPEALKNYFSSLKIKEELGDKKGIADSYNNVGVVYEMQGDYFPALKNHLLALNFRKELHDQRDIAASYNNIGNAYFKIGIYPEALNNHFASLKIQKEVKNKKGIADSYLNIGLVCTEQGNYPEALKYQLASLKIVEEMGNKLAIASTHANIGSIYKRQRKYSEALKSYSAALKISEEIQEKYGISNAFILIGNVYNELDNYPEALKNYQAALKIAEEMGNKAHTSISYEGIADIYFKQNRIRDAFFYSNQSLLLAKEMGDLRQIQTVYRLLAKLDSAHGNYRGAMEHFKLFITYRDSLFNEENTKKMVQTQMQYEFDKKESLAKVEQEKKDAISAKELQRQKFLRNGFVGGFVVVLLFAGVFFTQRNRIKKGKKRSDELLLNILPQEVAEELKQNGTAEAKQFDDVTVMFTDFKDFTKLSEKLSPAELVTQIDYCYKAFDGIMGKYNIEKIKTIGDSYMAAGGLPVRNKTNATDVVKAALEIQRFIDEDGQQKRSEGKEIIEVRIGVHSGPVVAGIVGIKKFAYDIWGDTVNIASRMEKASEPGKVNISGSTYGLVKDEFNCTYRGKIQAKNKGEIDMYFVEPN